MLIQRIITILNFFSWEDDDSLSNFWPGWGDNNDESSNKAQNKDQSNSYDFLDHKKGVVAVTAIVAGFIINNNLDKFKYGCEKDNSYRDERELLGGWGRSTTNGTIIPSWNPSNKIPSAIDV